MGGSNRHPGDALRTRQARRPAPPEARATACATSPRSRERRLWTGCAPSARPRFALPTPDSAWVVSSRTSAATPPGWSSSSMGHLARCLRRIDERDTWFATAGYRTLRFSNEMVAGNGIGSLRRSSMFGRMGAVSTVRWLTCSSPPPPTPPLEGEGSLSRCAYAELQATTNFAFLRGASHPGELVLGAKALGLSALAVCDRNSLAGVVRAHAKAKEVGLEVHPRLPARLRRRLAQRALLSHRPRGLRAADQAAHRRPAAGQEGRVRAAPGTTSSTTARASCSSWSRRPSLDDDFERRLTLALRPTSPGRVWLAAARGYAAQDLKRIARSTRWAAPPARRSWRPTTCSTTAPSGARCRTC